LTINVQNNDIANKGATVALISLTWTQVHSQFIVDIKQVRSYANST